MIRQAFLLLTIWLTTTAYGGEIIVREGESLHHALRKVREWRRTNSPQCQGGITIRIQKGRYYMQEPLFLRPEDSGTLSSPTRIVGEQGTVICGDPMQKHAQLWPLPGKEAPSDTVVMERMLAFDPVARTITIPTPPVSVRQIITSALRAENLEMIVHQRWAIAILRVRTLTEHDGSTIVTFREPESRLEFEHPWPQPVIGGERGNSSFLLRTTEQRDGIEQLVVVDGASYVSFEGITFENTCWNRPLHKGHVTLQGGFPIVDAYKLAVPGLPWDSDLENQAWVERPVSAVTVRNANHVVFTSCGFRHLGATALDYADNISDCKVTLCSFMDIGGTAIMGGSFAESPLEVHRPYGDLAKRCQRLTIDTNTIQDISREDWGAVAISLGYVRDCVVSNNRLDKMNYSGICIGWGWTPLYTGMEDNHIVGNKVENYARQLYDAGGIYTLSNQPNSSIRNNEIGKPYPAHYATNHRGFPIYLDARTDGFTIENNRTYAFGGSSANSHPIRRDEIGDNHPGPNIIFKQ